jgi:signal transduction histidine kinase
MEPPETRPDQAGEPAVYRVARGAINNLAQHPSARNMHVRLDQVEGHTVRDDRRQTLTAKDPRL